MLAAVVVDGVIKNVVVSDIIDNVKTFPLKSGKWIGDKYNDNAPPTELEQIRADIDFLAAMGGVTL